MRTFITVVKAVLIVALIGVAGLMWSYAYERLSCLW